MEKVNLYFQYVIGFIILVGLYIFLLDIGVLESMHSNLAISLFAFIVESLVMIVTNPFIYGLILTGIIYLRLKNQGYIIPLMTMFFLGIYPILFIRMVLDGYTPPKEYSYYVVEFVALQIVFQGIWGTMLLMKRKKHLLNARR